MQRSATSRKEMIRQLIEHSISRAVSESPQYWLQEIFEHGFVGYSLYSDKQLRLEMQLRGLDPSTDSFEEEADDEFSFSLAQS